MTTLIIAVPPQMIVFFIFIAITLVISALFIYDDYRWNKKYEHASKVYQRYLRIRNIRWEKQRIAYIKDRKNRDRYARYKDQTTWD